jgi:hypothetical protein
MTTSPVTVRKFFDKFPNFGFVDELFSFTNWLCSKLILWFRMILTIWLTCTCNIRSYQKSSDQLLILFSSLNNKIDVIALSEKWLPPNVPAVEIGGYDVFYNFSKRMV